MSAIELHPIRGIPEVGPGDDLAELIGAALDEMGLAPRSGDILAIAQKVVSKSEGRFVDLEQVEPSAEAHRIARRDGRDARLVEVVLRESREVVVASERALIVEHRSGAVCAHAGVDRSNLAAGDSTVLLLPEDADRSARRLRAAIKEKTGAELAVIVTDTQGRAFRRGVAGVAVGCAGVEPLVDLRGEKDRAGRVLEITILAQADEIAAAAGLAMGQAAEGVPAVLIRGLAYRAGEEPARRLFRTKEEDLFRA